MLLRAYTITSTDGAVPASLYRGHDAAISRSVRRPDTVARAVAVVHQLVCVVHHACGIIVGLLILLPIIMPVAIPSYVLLVAPLAVNTIGAVLAQVFMQHRGQVLITGIRPEIAQTLVGLGLDLSGITTRATLQSGIAFALSGRAIDAYRKGRNNRL